MKKCTLTDVIADALASPIFGMQATVARMLAEEILRTAAARGHSGSDYYLPNIQHLTRAERNALIRTEFNGRNLRKVCLKYDVSMRTVYRACRRFGS